MSRALPAGRPDDQPRPSRPPGARQPARGALLASEFDRQVAALLDRGFPALAGLSPAAFVRRLAPLRRLLPDAVGRRQPADRLPFVLAVTGDLVPRHHVAALLSLQGRTGVSVFEPDDLAAFAPLVRLRLPAGGAYLLLDVDTGRDTLNVTPDAALTTLVRRRRSPLTIDEGLAVVTHFPEVLRTHNCFSLLGSRRADRRVAALWVSRGHPKLGWCWAGNPHTWLGSASCRGRVGL